MGKLVIDGNDVYEIDEECVRKNRPPLDCGIYEYMDDYGQKISEKMTNSGKKRLEKKKKSQIYRNFP